MSKIYDALLRAELDRASSAHSGRADSDSPEAVLTRDILASLNQERWPAPVPPGPRVEEEDWRATADPEGVFPEPVAMWKPSPAEEVGVEGELSNVEPVPVAVVALKTCPNCSLPYGARTERKGFFQKHVASFFGYFPWTCKACRVNFYSKDRGASPPDVAKG